MGSSFFAYFSYAMMKGVDFMRITFRTYDVSSPGTVENMMLYAFIIQRTLTMYDIDYYTYHSDRVRDDDGDEYYYITIDINGSAILDEDELDEIDVILSKWRSKNWCGADRIG